MKMSRNQIKYSVRNFSGPFSWANEFSERNLSTGQNRRISDLSQNYNRNHVQIRVRTEL